MKRPLLALMALAGILGCFFVAAAEEGGTLTGILARKGGKWIYVKADGEKETRQYMPVWRGGLPKDGGSFDPETVAAIKGIPEGNRVRLEWKLDEYRRVLKIEALIPERRSGTATGTIADRGETWIDVTTRDGATCRYSPKWIGGLPKDGGRLDPEGLALFKSVKPGDAVTVSWTYDERYRLIALEKQSQ